MQDSIADFGLGETITGTNDDSVLINGALVGREYTFPVTEEVAKALQMSNRVVGRRVVARIMRNTTGDHVLAAGEIILVENTEGHEGLGKAKDLSAADERCCLVVDPALGSSTVALNDLFYAIVKGPTKVKQPATSAPSLVGGDVIKAGDDGRLAKGAVGSDHGILLGTVVKADNSTEDALVEVELAPEWV
jgi:hypothetical protein